MASVNPPLMKRLLDTTKKDTVVLGPLQRMLLGQDEFDDYRRADVLHPSELVDPDVCDLALYYRLKGWAIPKEHNRFQLEVVFEQGHGYHFKWQNWVWDLGFLRGRFRCMSCGHGDWQFKGKEAWFATSPDHCVSCGSTRRFLQYGEVPVWMPDYRIGGHSDGDLAVNGGPITADPLLEIKSIGEGTVRYEAPNLVRKHTKRISLDGKDRSWVDWRGIWRETRRPYRKHLKQGALYCMGLNRTEMVFIYEFKPTGEVKEFTVTYPDFDIIEEELELALDVLYAVEKSKPPDCPHGGCKLCQAFEALRDGAQDETETESEDREDSRSGASEGADSKQGDQGSSRARRGPKRTPGRHRPLGRRPHEPAEREAAVGDVPRREARRGGGDRRNGRGDSSSRSVRGDATARNKDAEGLRDRSKGSRRVVRRRPRG